MSFAREVVSGVKWSAASRYGEQVIGFITTALLARLLAPEAFGVLAMAGLLTGFLFVLADLGTATALVQRETVSRSLGTTVFWANLLMGAALTVLAYLSAPAVGGFFREPAVVPVVRVLSVGLLLNAVAAVPTALLTRNLAFDRLGRVQLAAAAVGGATGIGLALGGFGVWALVAQVLVRAGVETAGVLVVARFRPAMSFSRSDLMSVASFGISLSGFHMVNFVVRNVDNLLIGRVLGGTMLGYYDIAWRLIEYPKNALAGVVGRVMTPTYSRMQSDDARFGQAFLRVAAAIALVSVPAMLGLMVVAEPFLLLVFGEQWRPAVILLVILAPVGLAQSVGSTTGSVYVAKDRTGWLFGWSVLAGTVTAAAVVLGLTWGLVGVAVARLIANSLLSPVNFAIALRMLRLRLRDLGRVLAPIVAAGLIMVVAVALVRIGLGRLRLDSHAVVLSAGVITGAVVYASALWWRRPPILYEIFATLVMAGAGWARPWMARFSLAKE